MTVAQYDAEPYLSSSENASTSPQRRINVPTFYAHARLQATSFRAAYTQNNTLLVIETCVSTIH